MRRGHRSAHVKAVAASAVLAGAVIALGWCVRAARPVPERLAPVRTEAPAAGPEAEAAAHAGDGS